MHEYDYLLQCCATHSYLRFSHFHRSENGVRGEVISLGLSGDPFLCCVKACDCRVVHFYVHNTLVTIPLATAFINQTPHKIQPKHITKALNDYVTYLGTDLGFLASHVTARCLRASGANALLLAKVDTDIIRLIRQWCSDKML